MGKTPESLNSPDKNYLKGLIDVTVNSRIVIIGLIGIIITILVMMYGLMNQPKIITIIDKTTGETYATLSAQLNDDILQRQIMFYSKKFAEEYLSLDGATCIAKRKEALKMLHEATLQRIGSDAYYKTSEVESAIKNNYKCSYKWQRQPVITVKNHPRYTAFLQFERILEMEGYKPIVTQFNVKMDWIWQQGMDPYAKPHDLSVLEFISLGNESEELKNQLNLSYK